MKLDFLKFWKARDPGERERMPKPGDPDWERALINRMAAEFLREQRRSRRWGVIFRMGILAYLCCCSSGSTTATDWSIPA
jgi:protease-4